MSFTPEHDPMVEAVEQRLRDALEPDAEAARRVVARAMLETGREQPTWWAPLAVTALVLLVGLGAWWLLAGAETDVPGASTTKSPCVLSPREGVTVLSNACGEVTLIAASPAAPTRGVASSGLEIPRVETPTLTNRGEAVWLLSPGAPPRITLTGTEGGAP